MADEDIKKQIEEEMAQQQDATNKKQAEEQQAIIQSENEQDSANIELSDEEIVAAQQQEVQEEESQQSESTSVPLWMKEAVFFTLRYELDEGQSENSLSEASSTLGELAENGVIQAYEETVDGVKALMNMEGGQSVSFNFGENSASSNVLSGDVLNTITSVVSAIGGNNLDIGELKDSGSRFDAYKMANEKNFDVKGLDEDEKDNFEKTASLSKKL